MSRLYLFYIICYLPLAISGATSQYSGVSAFYRLKSTIYDGYDPMIRPVKDPWTVTNVTIGFTLKQVLSFDDTSETITVSAWPNMVSVFPKLIFQTIILYLMKTWTKWCKMVHFVHFVQIVYFRKRRGCKMNHLGMQNESSFLLWKLYRASNKMKMNHFNGGLI